MRTPTFSLVFALLSTAACSRSHQETSDQVPAAGTIQKEDRAFTKNDPDHSKVCKADADCPSGDICHPGDLRCISSYPEPRMLDMSFVVEQKCQLVNVFFAFDSANLVPEAERWLEYNVRCLKARQGHHVIVTAHSDPRGDVKYNIDLSQKRAEVVKQRLEALGVTLTIQAEGKGPEKLAGQERTERDFAWNRRSTMHVE